MYELMSVLPFALLEISSGELVLDEDKWSVADDAVDDGNVAGGGNATAAAIRPLDLRLQS